MWKSFEIFSMCCLIAPLFDPSCTPYVHALTLKGRTPSSKRLPPVTCHRFHGDGVSSSRVACRACWFVWTTSALPLSSPRERFCSFSPPKRHTWKSLFKMMHPLHEDVMWADFKVVFFFLRDSEQRQNYKENRFSRNR